PMIGRQDRLCGVEGNPVVPLCVDLLLAIKWEVLRLVILDASKQRKIAKAVQPEAVFVIGETLTPVGVLERLRQNMLDGDFSAEVLGDRLVLIGLFKPQQDGLRKGPPINLAVKQRTELIVVGIGSEDRADVIRAFPGTDRGDELKVRC